MPAPNPDNPAPDQTHDASRYRPWLHRLSFVALAATFALVAIGGHVTSTESGMAVPDGWYTFGWWSLFAPPSEWWHNFGTFWEHSHRLQGNVVGMLSIAMAVWLYVTYTDWQQLNDSNPTRGRWARLVRSIALVHGTRPKLRWAGVLMLLWVCAQGALGAFRVDEVSITLAFIHGISGQMILCFWVLIAAALSRPWVERVAAIRAKRKTDSPRWLRVFAIALLLALFVQLTLGAAVRHYKADKAIPDFPMHYGQVLPPMSQDELDEAYLTYYANEAGLTLDEAVAGGWSNRGPRNGEIVIPLWKVHLQFTHRVWAYTLLIGGITLVVTTMRSTLDKRLVMTPAMTLLALFVLQVSLGAITVMTETDIFAATMHQATGALLIATATWLSIRVHLAGYPAKTRPPITPAVPHPAEPTDTPSSKLLPHTTA
ncbi:MAG: heme A synthase [Phycisphaerales bacterium JB063]